MGSYVSSNVQTFFTDTTDPYLQLCVRCQIVTETISIPLNIFLLIFFHRLHMKQTTKLKSIDLNLSTIILTYLLLIFGATFGILQGFFENFALTDCANIINTYFEFFFYIGHRILLSLIFLDRLYTVFKGSNYKYPNFVYYILFILIIINGILSFFSHSFNLSILKVPSGWNLWNDDNVCAWQFGPFVTHITRPIDFGLSIIILFLFLYKLYIIHKVTKQMEEGELRSMKCDNTASVLTPSSSPRSISDKTDNLSLDSNGDTSMSPRRSGKKKVRDKYARRRRQHSALEIVARRMTILTFTAIISSIIVTGGYLGYSLRIIGALWSFDITLNSYCCILMFKFTHFTVKPCFGKKCDRCFCIKFLGCCDCVFIGRCCIRHDDHDHDQIELVKMSDKNTQLQIQQHIKPNTPSGTDVEIDD